MLAGEEEVVRAWYHQHLPGGMVGDWRKQAADLRKDGASASEIYRSIMLRGCAELGLQGRLHVTCESHNSDFRNCVWCRSGTSKI